MIYSAEQAAEELAQALGVEFEDAAEAGSKYAVGDTELLAIYEAGKNAALEQQVAPRVTCEIASDELIKQFGKGRPLPCSLDEYWKAPGSEGEMAYQWSDKPHRLLYDLISAVLFYANTSSTKPTVDTPNNELPGMWERADFEGGQDEVRGPDWKPNGDTQ